jgi:hypothetical protein
MTYCPSDLAYAATLPTTSDRRTAQQYLRDVQDLCNSATAKLLARRQASQAARLATYFAKV